jgi:hypothetical protein
MRDQAGCLLAREERWDSKRLSGNMAWQKSRFLR